MYKEIFYYSSQVCEQLACELVTEQAQLLKHETLVNELKEKIVEGKKQIIKKLILGKEFLLEGKRMIAIKISFFERMDDMEVTVTMGLEPDECIMPNSVTKREQRLIDLYKDSFYSCKECHDENSGSEASYWAHRLFRLKNHHLLTQCFWGRIDFANATTPGFFEQSGIVIHEEKGYYMLEDLVQ
jgi:hypothetical protein